MLLFVQFVTITKNVNVCGSWRESRNILDMRQPCVCQQILFFGWNGY